MANTWKMLRFERTPSPKEYGEFTAKTDGTGVYCIVVDYGNGKFVYLGDRNLFDIGHSEIVITGTDPANLSMEPIHN